MSINKKVGDLIAKHVNTLDDVRAVQDLLKVRLEAIRREKRRVIMVGNVVSFTGRDGVTHKGTIQKINVKKAVVLEKSSNPRSPNTLWNVPFTMLEIAQ